jgi:hypothetical protein
MLRLLKKTRRLAIDFCERCGCVCDAACRTEALRERALVKALQRGGRV